MISAGQMSLGFEEGLRPERLPTVREIDPGQRVAVSSLIKRISALRDIDASDITERDITMLTPAYLNTGLYVPSGMHDADFSEARNHVIFPADEFKVITTSPARLASTAATGVRKKRQDDPNKELVEEIAGRSSAHSLFEKIKDTERLREALNARYSSLAAFNKVLMSAKGTGFFANHGQEEVRIMIGSAETEIFALLDLTAKTKGWNAEQYERAKRTLQYKLFGDHPDRYKNWKEFLPIAQGHLRRRRAVVLGVRQSLERELAKYKHFVDEE